MFINDNILKALNEIFAYASHVDEWMVIKKELLKTLRIDDRKFFSTRDPITKKQRPNELELKLASLWSSMTKRPVIIKDYEEPK